jgi:hypothetical protein
VMAKDKSAGIKSGFFGRPADDFYVELTVYEIVIDGVTAQGATKEVAESKLQSRWPGKKEEYDKIKGDL